MTIGITNFAHQQKNIPCANAISCVNNLSAVVENDASGFFLGQQITTPQIDLSSDQRPSTILGVEDSASPKHIYVDLSEQKLYAFEGNEPIFETLVSTGKWGRTPPGEYRIWVKIRSTRMAGGSGNDAYNLPNVPYVMFFYNDQVSKDRGYSLHGAYWHNNFGHEMSHGCVNMRTIDAEVIYNWASPTTKTATTHESKDDPGTPVSICNQVQLEEGATPLCLE